MQSTLLRLWTEIAPEKESLLRDALSGEYDPLIQSMKKSFADALHVSPVQGELHGGELFHKKGDFFFYRIPPERNYIEAGGVSSAPDFKDKFSSFSEKINQIISPGEGSSWKEIQQASLRFQWLRQMACEPTFSPDEMKAAFLLRDGDLFRLLKQIAAGDPGTSGEAFEKLEEAGLLRRDVNIYCRKTNALVTTISLQSGCGEESARGFKCFVCGRPVMEERVERATSLTSLGQNMLTGPNWLGILLVNSIRISMTGNAHFLLLRNNGDEFSCLFVNFGQQVIQFCIKDTPWKLQDVYLISKSRTFFAPDSVCLLSPEPLSGEVKRFLSTFQGWRAFSLENLEEDIGEFFEQKMEIEAGNLLVPLEMLTRVDLCSMLADSFLAAPTEEESHPSKEAPSPAEKQHQAAEREDNEFYQEASFALAAANATREIKERGIPASLNALEKILLKIRQSGPFDCALFDLEGIQLLQPSGLPDAAGPAAVEVNRNIQRSLEECNFPRHESISLMGHPAAIHLFDVPEGVFLVMDKRLHPTGERKPATDDGAASKDALLKKVLEDLLAPEFVRGNLVVTRDGLLIDSLVRTEEQIDLLSAMGSQIFSDNEKNFKKLAGETLRQMIIRMPQLVLSIIPIDEEILLITLLQSVYTRDVLYRDLPAAAGRLSSIMA
ncbi:MAG: roadblock/LC7 domain-containing protein [bacterium]